MITSKEIKESLALKQGVDNYNPDVSESAEAAGYVWIGVKDSLPTEFNRKYWVTDGVEQWAANMEFFPNGNSFITHWMELPPYPNT